MFKHTIFGLLKSFSAEEKRRFSKFISSPYYNESKKLNMLYKEIMKHYPLFTHVQLTKENLFKKLNPERKYKDAIIRDLLYDLQNLVLKFIILERINKSESIRNDCLLKELIARNQQKLFLKSIERIESSEGNMNGASPENIYYYYKREVNKINFNTLYSRKIKKVKAEKDIEVLKSNTTNFIVYFITEIIDEYLKMLFKSSRFNIVCEENFPCHFLEKLDIDGLIKNSPCDNQFVFMIEVYNSMYKTFRFMEEDKYYNAYKKIVLKYSDKLSHPEMTGHFAKLINYCLFKINSMVKIKEFKTELMRLYEIVLENNYFLTDKAGYLPSELFRAILFLCVELKKPEWNYNYIKKYSRELNPEDSENLQNFGYAYFYNSQGDYEKSLSYIGRVPLDNFNYKFDEKNLKLKNFFELKYFEESLCIIDSYKKQLGKIDLISDERKIRHRNFLSFLEKIVLFKTGKPKIDIGLVKNKLEECEQVHFKDWLLEKINEIEIGVAKVG